MTELNFSLFLDKSTNVILTFFIYCFLGWIWEEIVEGIRQRKIANRGLLTGPYIPIYGFGGTIIYYTLLPFEDNIVLLYIMGLIIATLLEYVTAVIMENIFKIKLWNYDTIPLNFQGRICLIASLFWGVVGVVVVRFSTPFIMNKLGMFYHDAKLIVATTLTTIFILDAFVSFASLVNLKVKIKNIMEAEKKFIPSLDKIQSSIPNFSELKENYIKNVYKLGSFSISNSSIKRISRAFPKMKFKSEKDQKIFSKIKENIKINKKKK